MKKNCAKCGKEFEVNHYHRVNCFTCNPIKKQKVVTEVPPPPKPKIREVLRRHDLQKMTPEQFVKATTKIASGELILVG